MRLGRSARAVGWGRGRSPCTATYSQLSKFPLLYTYIDILSFLKKKIILKFGT